MKGFERETDYGVLVWAAGAAAVQEEGFERGEFLSGCGEFAEVVAEFAQGVAPEGLRRRSRGW